MINQDDKEFDEYLKGETELSRLYAESGDVQVPGVLDEVILAAAKDKLSKKNINRPASPFSGSWQLPMSLAAVLVLSVGLVIGLYDEYGKNYLQQPVSEKSEPDQNTRSDKIHLQELILSDDENRTEEEVLIINDAENESIYDGMEPQYDDSAEAYMESVPSVQGATIDIQEPDVINKQSSSGSGSGSGSGFSSDDEIDSNTPIDLKMKNRIQKLEHEVTDLKRTEEELIEEKESIKKELESIKDKKEVLKMKVQKKQPAHSSASINSNDVMMLPDEDIANSIDTKWLGEINELWNTGEKDAAHQQLQAFRKEYPDVSEQELLRYLSDELVTE